MFKEIISHLSNQELDKINDKQCHLGIFSEPFLTFMMDGRKTIESRFSKNKIAPFKQITKNDIVFIKKSSGNVIGYLTIKDVLFFDLSITPIENIKEKYSKELCVDEKFWEAKRNSNYATLIIIDEVIKLEPFKINKKGMQTWIVLK